MASGGRPGSVRRRFLPLRSRPSMAEESGAAPRLAELLATGQRLWEEVESGTELSSGDPAVQEKVRRGLEALQRAAAMVAQLELFRSAGGRAWWARGDPARPLAASPPVPGAGWPWPGAGTGRLVSDSAVRTRSWMRSPRPT